MPIHRHHRVFGRLALTQCVEHLLVMARHLGETSAHHHDSYSEHSKCHLPVLDHHPKIFAHPHHHPCTKSTKKEEHREHDLDPRGDAHTEIVDARDEAGEHEGQQQVRRVDADAWATEAVTGQLTNDYDLLITDYFMPMLSGTSLIEFVRSKEYSKDMKVLMITAYAMALSDETLRRLGEKVLLKPVTLAVLGETVQEIMGKMKNIYLTDYCCSCCCFAWRLLLV